MTAIAAAISIVSTIVGAYGQYQAGQQEKAVLDRSAEISRINAGQALAGSQGTAQDKIREATLLGERAQAVAAASGGGATDPTVATIEENISGRGLYNALGEMYRGSEEARGDINQANADTYAGQQAASAGTIRAISTVVSGGTTLYEKYGGGGAVMPTENDLTSPGVVPGSGWAAAYGGTGAVYR